MYRPLDADERAHRDCVRARIGGNACVRRIGTRVWEAELCRPAGWAAGEATRPEWQAWLLYWTGRECKTGPGTSPGVGYFCKESKIKRLIILTFHCVYDQKSNTQKAEILLQKT